MGKNVNFAVREACNRCQEPKPQGDYGLAPAYAPQAYAPAYAPAPQQNAGGGGKAPVAGVDGNWACPQCQNVNFAVREVCNRCQAPKPAPRGLAQLATGMAK